MNANTDLSCWNFVLRALRRNQLPREAQEWVLALCSWGIAPEFIALFVYEHLDRPERDGDLETRSALVNTIIAAINEGDRDRANQLLVELGVLALGQEALDVWELIIKWVFDNHSYRSFELLPALWGKHIQQPFSTLDEAIAWAEQWLKQNAEKTPDPAPPRPPRPRPSSGP